MGIFIRLLEKKLQKNGDLNQEILLYVLRADRKSIRTLNESLYHTVMMVIVIL